VAAASVYWTLPVRREPRLQVMDVATMLARCAPRESSSRLATVWGDNFHAQRAPCWNGTAGAKQRTDLL